jgi:hypothetical protein
MNRRWHRFAFVALDRVRLDADLTILAKLACTLARARGAPLAAEAPPQNTGPTVDPVCLKGALPRRAGRGLA